MAADVLELLCNPSNIVAISEVTKLTQSLLVSSKAVDILDG